jgi:hypothetical protein
LKRIIRGCNSIPDSLTEREFYKAITIISSIIKDGHTIILPGSKITDFYNENGKFLPYHFVILNGKLYIDMNYTNDNSIQDGSEIMGIDNVDAVEIIKQLSDRQVRDGDNKTYPEWILSNYFRQYYGFIFGHPETYNISFKTNDKINTQTINALSRDSIYYYRAKKYPGRIFSNLPNEGIKLKIDNEHHYALLTIKDFHNDILKKTYKQNFEKTIRSCFEQINDNKTENLIIDLRNNQGGDIENGVYLLSYLLEKPFSVVQEYFCVNDFELKHCNGPSLGLHEPKPNNFKGRLYVLINGGSFSNSAIVSSCLQENNRAIFVGQETGGNPSVIEGFTEEKELPNTKISIQVPTKQFVITDKSRNTGRGIMPTIPVVPKLTDILTGNDTELMIAIDEINKLSSN